MSMVRPDDNDCLLYEVSLDEVVDDWLNLNLGELQDYNFRVRLQARFDQAQKLLLLSR